MYPISYAADYEPEGRSRLSVFFRYFAAIPWLIVNAIYGIGAYFAIIIAWFAIVFTGRYPEGLYNFNAGYLRNTGRINSFYYLMTDKWPPFGGEENPEYPVRVGVAPPLDKYSRAKTFFRAILFIPMYFILLVQLVILAVVTIIAWFAILFTGKHPEGLYGPARSALAYFTRATAYMALMTETYPPFSYDENVEEPVGAIPTESASRQQV